MKTIQGASGRPLIDKKGERRMATDTARQAELRRQIAKEMTDALGLDSANLVQSALENSLDAHHAHIEEDAHHAHHKSETP